MTYEQEDDEGRLDHCPELALWRAVLYRAVIDAQKATQGENTELVYVQALNWFGSPAFRVVCERGGLNPDWVLPCVRNVIPGLGGKKPIRKRKRA